MDGLEDLRDTRQPPRHTDWRSSLPGGQVFGWQHSFRPFHREQLSGSRFHSLPQKWAELTVSSLCNAAQRGTCNTPDLVRFSPSCYWLLCAFCTSLPDSPPRKTDFTVSLPYSQSSVTHYCLKDNDRFLKLAFQSLHGLAATQCALPTGPPISLTRMGSLRSTCLPLKAEHRVGQLSVHSSI